MGDKLTVGSAVLGPTAVSSGMPPDPFGNNTAMQLHSARRELCIDNPARVATLTAERDALRAQVEEARAAIQAAIDCGMVPTTSASEGGASRYAEQVIVADRLRQVIAKPTGSPDG